MKNNFGYIVGVSVIVALMVILGPLVLIWSLNTLFPVLAIQYSFWTWLAALFLAAAVKNSKVEVQK